MIWLLIIAMLLPLAGCFDFKENLKMKSTPIEDMGIQEKEDPFAWLWPPNWFKPAEPPPEPEKRRVTDNDIVKHLFARGDWLMTVLILAGVGGIILGLWARMKEAFFVTAGCWLGAAMLIALAAWAWVVGLLMLAVAVVLFIGVAVRWKHVADAAIDYAETFKGKVGKKDKETINAEAEEIQSRGVQDYIFKQRKLVKKQKKVADKATY
jgi:hypothetical protein